MKMINRNLALIKPEEPLLEWLQRLPGPETPVNLDTLRTECTALLIPEFRNNEQAQEYIYRREKSLFELELRACVE